MIRCIYTYKLEINDSEMNKVFLYTIVGVIVLFFTTSQVYAQNRSQVQSYRIGSHIAPGTNHWALTYGENFKRTIHVSIVKDINRYKLLIRSNDHLGDIEIVLNDNSSINCVRRPHYDHYLDGRLQSIYYLTEQEVSKLSSVNISHIVTQEVPDWRSAPRGNAPRYYRYMNRYQEVDGLDWKYDEQYSLCRSIFVEACQPIII
jgi:hypothetical protein